jgi:antitoxin component YwqK of YwqJK toxin-antitoxin module
MINQPETINSKDTVWLDDGKTYKKNSDTPFTGIEESFHENGQLMVRTNYKNGQQEGLYEWFYENGQLSWRGNYKNGKQDGLWEYFDSDGNLEEIPF